MSTVVVQGGLAALPEGAVLADVLVDGPRIAGLGAPGEFAGAGETIDARGMLVLPGLVDAHVHVRDPGLTDKEDFASAGAAAAAGGVTTIVAMPYDDPLTTSAGELAEKAASAQERCIVDVAFAAAVGAVNLHALEDLARAGAVCADVLLDGAPAALGAPGLGTLREVLAASHAVSLPVAVYCETPEIAAAARSRLLEAGRSDIAAHAASHPAVGERIAVEAACALALETGAALHLRQLSCAASLAAAESARRNGADVSVEVTPHHLALTGRDAVAAGPALKVLPPLREPADAEALRRAVLAGPVDVIATDHAPHSPADRAGGGDAWRSPSGFAGLETMVAVLLTMFGNEAPRVIATACAERPARRFGLARKGAIAAGMDADLALVDPDATWTVDPGRLHSRAGASPFAGRELRGRVRLTMRRGEVIARDGEVDGSRRGEQVTPGGRPVATGPAA